MAQYGNLEDAVSRITSSEQKEAQLRREAATADVLRFQAAIAEFSTLLRDVPKLLLKHGVEPRKQYKRSLDSITVTYMRKRLLRSIPEDKSVPVACLYPTGWPIEFWAPTYSPGVWTARDKCHCSDVLVDLDGNFWAPPTRTEVELKRIAAETQGQDITIRAVPSKVPKRPDDRKHPWPGMQIEWAPWLQDPLNVQWYSTLTENTEEADASESVARWVAGLIEGNAGCCA